MSLTLDALTAHLLRLLHRVQQSLGQDEPPADDPGARFADLLDSMAMVEFVAVLADECGVALPVIEACVDRRFTTVAELAAAMYAAGLRPRPIPRSTGQPAVIPFRDRAAPLELPCWLCATAVRLPATVETAAALDEWLGRPCGWLTSHAGLESRRVWGEQDPLQAAADAALACLSDADLSPEEMAALLVTSEAPPRLAGLAAALHHRAGLRPDVPALELGGACTGLLSALWTAQALLARAGPVLVIALEAPSHHLRVEPGPSAEAAALFGDGAAAAVLCDRAVGRHPVPLAGVILGADGGAGDLLQVRRRADNRVEVHMDGPALAGRAITMMAEAAVRLATRHGLRVSDVEALVVHGGNGRMPGLLARHLGVPLDKVWSETPHAGNLGSVSLPAAWAAHAPPPQGPVLWTAVGAGLTWAAAITGVEWD